MMQKCMIKKKPSCSVIESYLIERNLFPYECEHTTEHVSVKI